MQRPLRIFFREPGRFRGKLYSQRREILGGQGGQCEEQTFQSLGHSVHYEKAMVERMKRIYHVDWFTESGESYPVRVFIKKDEVTVGLDTTGESLHKRGYRKLTAKAPIAENLAAGLLMLTPWRGNRILVDPFCGSGTIPIEAAMMAARMAPGRNRSFQAGAWKHIVPDSVWGHVKEEADSLVDLSVKTDIQGYDIDDEMVSIARANAKLAGVDHLIHFQQRGVEQLSHAKNTALF